MLRSLAMFLALLVAAPSAAQAPRLEHGELIVDGKPFLLLGGELGNSSASSRTYMAPHWARLRAAGLNTVLAPVSWELIEPNEGRFDFATVDALIEDARASDLRLVLLWFGSWKNSMSTYVPAWVKRDTRRFPRVRDAGGVATDMLSALGSETRDADARAFAALMTHLAEVDGAQRTVLMVQVENEVGLLGSPRERGAAANAAFAAPVPAALIERLGHSGETPLATLWRTNGARRSGSWSQLFGSGDAADEAFTAWHYARFVEAVAAAGKAKYRLPLYVNAALARPGKLPGDYPAGGPLLDVAEAWQAGAPSIDLLSPDIYFPNFAEITAGYAALNPLFVPEASRPSDPRLSANAWLAFGQHRAFGFSPFAIESIDGAAEQRLGETYRLIESIAPLLLAAQRSKRVFGFAQPVAADGTVDEQPQQAQLGGTRFTVTMIDPWTPRDQQHPDEHGGLILQLAPDEFLFAGTGVTVTMAPADGKGAIGIEAADEGRYIDGRWQAGRRLNGDQTHQGRHVRLPPGTPTLQRVKLYRYR